MLEVTQPPASHPATLRPGGEPAAARVQITFFVRESDAHAWSGSSTARRTSCARSTATSRSTSADPVTYTWDGRTDAGAASRRPGATACAVDLPRDRPRDDLAAADHRATAVRPAPTGGASVNASALELIGILVACGAAAAALVLEDRRAQPRGDGRRAGRRAGARRSATSGTSPGWSTSATARRRSARAVVVGGDCARGADRAVPPPPGRASRSRRLPSCRSGSRSRSAARRRTCSCRSTW